MAEGHSVEEMNKALFMNLVMMLGASAMQQLGKLVNPVTHTTEIDLEGAQTSIDMLVMLEARTKGNLESDEQRMLQQTLSTLQLNFVETAQSAPKDKEAQPGDARAPEVTQGKEPTADGKEPDAARKEPKYHKAYGDKA